jgi:hypothetical protein
MKHWIAITVACLVALTALSACGDDDNAPDDARASAVGAMSENAVDAWIADGAAGLHDYLATSVTVNCSVTALETALAGQPTPTAWRNTKDFGFPAEDEANATVIVVRDGKDVEQAWSFKLDGNDWRITAMPGLEGCTSS